MQNANLQSSKIVTKAICQMQNKAVFLDRDGVLNKEIGDYVYRIEDFEIIEGIIPTLHKLKEHGYKLIVITNQAGISKKIYTHSDVHKLHEYFQKISNDVIDHFYYAPHHPDHTSESLARKPGSLLFEKGIAKFNVDPKQSWMIGDKERDLIPAQKLGMKTIRLLWEGYYSQEEKTIADFSIDSISPISGIILKQV